MANRVPTHLLLAPTRLALAATRLGALFQNLIAHQMLQGCVRLHRGEGAGILDPAAHHAHGIGEREAVRVLPGRAGRLMQKVAYGVVRQHQPFDFLFHQFRGLGAQNRMAAQQVRLDLVVGRFDLPALVVERGQFASNSDAWRCPVPLGR